MKPISPILQAIKRKKGWDLHKVTRSVSTHLVPSELAQGQSRGQAGPVLKLDRNLPVSYPDEEVREHVY